MSKFNYGGQAVIEGIMMRGKHFWAIAVRKESDLVTIKHGPVQTLSSRFLLLGKPVIRGFVALVETLILGMRSLTYSANEFAQEEQEELTTRDLVLTFIVAIGLTIGFFVMLPAYIVRHLQTVVNSNILLNFYEGAIKISFFLLYIMGISWMKDIQRVFQYHGAEHQAINCYETDEELTIENVRAHSRIHARCGTNFILIVFFMSIFVFSFFGRPPFLQRILTHLAITPIVAGLSYEIIRKAGKTDCHPIFQLVALPGKGLQYLTTRVPDDGQIAVAIDALQTVMEKDASHAEAHKVHQLPIASRNM